MRLPLLLLALTACTSEQLDPGRALTCTDCGPGAVATGRFIRADDGPDAIAANRVGHVVRAAGSEVAWLDATLRPVHLVELEHASDRFDLRRIAIADDDEVVVVAHTEDDFDANPELREIAADGSQRWAIDLGADAEPNRIAIGPSLVFLGPANGSGRPYKVPGHTLMGNFILAINRATGTFAWEVQLPPGEPVDGSPLRLAALPDGGVAVSGAFTGTLALGGTAAPIVANPAARASGYVAALDADGYGRWALELDPGESEARQAAAGLGALAAGPHGEVAVTGAWDGANATFGDVPLVHMHEGPYPVGQMVALVGADGTITWAHAFGRRNDTLDSLVTDGTEVIGAGGKDAAVSFDADRTEPEGSDGYIVSTDTAQRWFRAARGRGNQDVTLHALTSDGVFASVNSWSDDETPTLSIGDVTATGSGFLIAKLAR